MIPFVRDMAFEYGQPDQVSPLIRRVVARNPGPFTYLGTGTYIVGRGEVAVIDPGPVLDEHLDAIVRATAGERITHIITTHTHMDHSPLAGPLRARTGATVIGLPDPGDASGEHGDLAFAPDVQVQEGQRIAGPGWTLEAIATPGHASNHVAYALTEEYALLVGDHVMGWSTTVVQGAGARLSRAGANPRAADPRRRALPGRLPRAPAGPRAPDPGAARGRAHPYRGDRGGALRRG